MTFADCKHTGGHSYTPTGLKDSLGREIDQCSKCEMPVYRDEAFGTTGLLIQTDAIAFAGAARERRGQAMAAGGF